MFEFYFQSGEFSGGEWSRLKDFLIPVLGLGVPLWIFYEGIKKQRKQDTDRLDTTNRQRLLYFNSLFTQAVEFGLHFQESLRDVITHLDSNLWEVRNRSLISSSDLRRIVFDLDRESVFYAYKTKLDGNEITTLFRAFDALYDLEKAYNEFWSKSSQEIYDRRNLIRANSADFINMIYQKSPLSPLDQQIKERIEQILHNFDDTEGVKDSDPKATVEQLVTPITDTLLSAPKSSYSDWSAIEKKGTDIIILGMQIESIAKQLKINLQTLEGTLKDVIDSISLNYLPLEAYLSSIENTK